jgi:hypothetical protein
VLGRFQALKALKALKALVKLKSESSCGHGDISNAKEESGAGLRIDEVSLFVPGALQDLCQLA